MSHLSAYVMHACNVIPWKYVRAELYWKCRNGPFNMDSTKDSETGLRHATADHTHCLKACMYSMYVESINTGLVYFPYSAFSIGAMEVGGAASLPATSPTKGVSGKACLLALC